MKIKEKEEMKKNKLEKVGEKIKDLKSGIKDLQEHQQRVENLLEEK